MSYCICCKFIGLFCLFWTMVAYFIVLGLFQLKYEGTLELEHAEGTVTITREKDTMIPHIVAKDYNGAIYGQGFANAQSRLWNMEKMRRAAKGKLSEVFGDSQLENDKMMR